MNGTLETIAKLRSIHGDFSEREITGEDLETILSSMVRAATASAQQSYSVVVVSDREVMKKYIGYVGSRALVFCVDYTRLARVAERLGLPYSFDGPVCFLTGIIDTLLAAQTAAVAAKALGLDSLFTNSLFRGDLRAFRERFGLPARLCFPLVSLVLGYAENSDAQARERLLSPGIVHRESYRTMTGEEIDDIILAYDDPARRLGLTFDRPSFEGSYMEWFFTRWLKGGPDAGERRKEILSMLGEAGFL